MGWLLMFILNAVPFSILVSTESECYAMGHNIIDYYAARDIQVKAMCRRVFEI